MAASRPNIPAPRSGLLRAFLIGLLPNAYIIFASLLGMADVFIYCIGGAYPCSNVVSDTIGFAKITGALYAALGLILGYKSPTQILQTGAGLGLPLLLAGILLNASGIQVEFRPAASQWLIVNALTFGVPSLAALVGAFGGARLRLRLRSPV